VKKLLFLSKFAVGCIWFLLAFVADGIGSTPAGPQLPALSYTPADRLRGAVLASSPYDDPTTRFWRQVEEFPKWGGNVFSINLGTTQDGVAILPGRPLTERLAKALERYTTVIDWALQHNIHIIIRFGQRSTAGGGPLTWPDDGRSIWKDASAQDELIQAWADLAKRFKDKKGMLFVPLTEPHGETADEIAGNHALPKQVWNNLYPRLINAIRAEDPERWVIVMPIWGSVDNLVDLSVSSAPNLIYSFHFYDPHFFTHQGLISPYPPAQSVVYPGLTRDDQFDPEIFWDKSVIEQALLRAVNFRNTHNVRVMCGEFGTQNQAPMDSRERWVTDVVDLLETYGFDWVYWTYNPVRPIPTFGDWTFQRTAYESVVTSKFSLNLEYGDFDASGNLLLAGGVEKSGLSRGPMFRLFNNSGTLQTTKFALNPDFNSELSFVLGNFDADGANEVLVGGRETSGLARGPAYQLFGSDGTSKFTRFVLSPDFSYVIFSPLNVGSNGVLVCGREIDGLARGPAYQAFDANGNLVHGQFVLNPDFVLRACMASNLDGISGDEVIVLGRELVGLERGLAIQGFGPTGSLLFTRFITNGNLAETGLTAVDVGNGSKNIVVYAREFFTNSRGPAFQLFDSGGNLLLVKFVLNPDFTAFQLFGANTTNSRSGQEIVTGGTETGGLARGPMYQVWDRNGNLLSSRFVLNADFTEVTFSKIDINNDGLDEILVVGRETKGLQRGPAFQLFDGNGNLLVTQFVLNSDFTNLKVFTVDQNGDGDNEIGIGGIETSGLKRGPAYQIFESNGALLQTRFVLSPADFPDTHASVDFDGDGKSDIGVYRDGNWFIRRTADGGVTAVGWGGLVQDTPVPADYDGDGRTDIAVYRSSDGGWYILRSSDGGVTATGWGGLPQDKPVPADYDGDGKTDIAVYRDGMWFIRRSSDGGVTATGWGGLPQDKPVAADYDGDGRTDVAVYRDGTWFVLLSSGGVIATGWGGLPQDKPVPADYDGDGKTDIAVYRDGIWFILRSSDGGVTATGWGGLAQDKPVPADYDGDGKADIAVYRDGIWFVLQSSNGGVTTTGWGGLAQDIPL
jgi:Cellulase (glycosyl hydrolase family 5)/FG-GAP-like repeat